MSEIILFLQLLSFTLVLVAAILSVVLSAFAIIRIFNKRRR